MCAIIKSLIPNERKLRYVMAKRSTISLRIDLGTATRLDRLGDMVAGSKSEVVRQAIKLMYEEYIERDVPSYDGRAEG